MIEEQIVKALELCIGEKNCVECPYEVVDGDYRICTTQLSGDIRKLIDLKNAEIGKQRAKIAVTSFAEAENSIVIDKQKAEIRELKNMKRGIEKIAMKYFAREEELERLRLEIEILIRKKEALRDEIAEKDAEIERLKAEIRNTDNILYSLDRPLEEIKFEAYREFAERVKQISKEVTVHYAADTSIQEHKLSMFWYTADDLDNLLKELTEKNDKG